MKYRVLIVPHAEKELGQLPAHDYQATRDAILELANNPRPPGCTKLQGREGWRIRQGDYRVIYEIDDEQHTVIILRVRHRREAYR
ncbi:MAG: type II toxin-antitoxin system RelE/ParE family toxin [Anaerolineae bacterium]